jgi:hypothetical protein
MAADGDPCCYGHYAIGLMSLSLEVTRSERVPRTQDTTGVNARVDAALGGDWRWLIQHGNGAAG